MAKHKILIVEDDTDINNLLKKILATAGFIVEQAFSGTEATFFFNKDTPDLLLLDLMLPGMSGEELLRQIREKQKCNIPVLVLSAKSSLKDKVALLGIGADEFITKPFSPSVLMARIKANLRKKMIITANAEESINFGEFTLLLNSCVLKKENTKIPLSTKEYKVLEFLVKNAGRILSPEEIYKNVWEVEFGDLTAVAVYIQRLRKKLEKDITSCEYIKTEFGKGYIFNKEKINGK